MELERAAHLTGSCLYLVAAVVAVLAVLRGGRHQHVTLVLLAVALVVHGLAILARWHRLDHGPYVNMFEVLSSNIWSLHAAVLVGAVALPRLRPALAASLPVVQVLVLWGLLAVAEDSPIPVTYETAWLPVHVWLGKLFLGLVVVALGGCLVILLRAYVRPGAFPMLPSSRVMEEISARLVLLAFVFECLMLVAGALWAQDAWGRYWAWDPLETWSFATWIVVAIFLHLRLTVTLRPEWSALLVVGVFVLAFATFFGMPFVSTAPHKGMV